ncbi:MAG: PAS domain S-box protein [bacterium]|nr:PAS domain S-box protein [bacterium]
MKKRKTIPSFPVVGIGGSAGGLRAFKELLKNLPDKTGMAFVFIMHLLPEHKSALPELLSEVTKMPVSRVKNGMRVKANHVFVIPPDMNISISDGKLLLKNMTKTDLPHMPLDYFFHSLAKEIGMKAIGVILSGTGSDGTLGAEAIKTEGGITFSQDDKTAEYDGMPNSAIASGCVDFVFSPKKIAEELARIVKHPVISPAETVKLDEKGFEEVFKILLASNGLDFTNYKDATISRRILRRMVLLKLNKIKDYVKYLRGNKDEVGKLYEDLLINVTEFFRDPEVFNTLKKRVCPEILKKKTKDQDVRIWVSGCSTGEDVYSIAICMFEAMENKTKKSIQIFATDVSENSIRKARKGIYGETIKDNITPERLKRFFIKEGNFYKVSKQLREICIFSRQNVFNDPPFSNIDLIICRNLLIYLQPVLQKRVFQNFHYSLIPGGFLVLGSSESVGGYSSFFDALDRKHRIFVRKPLSARLPYEFAGKYYHPKNIEIKEEADTKKIKKNDIDIVIDRILLNEYAVCGALIDSNMEVVQFRGHTGAFLESPAGKPSLNIFKLAREGLLSPLRSAIYKARVTKQTVINQVNNIKYNKRKRRVDITVIPVRLEGLKVDYFLVLFEEIPNLVSFKNLPKVSRKSLKDEKYVEAMQKELLETKEYLQTVIEAQENSNEELKTANEEILSSNEELQSANEELETSKEELQSSNEELTTTNEELNNRNMEVSSLNNDLLNLLGSINMPVIMMDTGLVIRKITLQAEKALNLTSSDIGRPINKIKLNVDIPDLEKLLFDVIESLRPAAFEIKDKQENWYFVNVRPYRTMDNKIDGVVMVFIDITKIRQGEEALRESENKYRTMIDHSNDMIWSLDIAGNFLFFNKRAEEISGFSQKDLIGKSFAPLIVKDDLPKTIEIFKKTLGGESLQYEVSFYNKEGRLITLLVDSTPLLLKGVIAGTTSFGKDITERKEIEKTLMASEELYRTLIENMNLSICLIDKDYKLIMANSKFCEMFGVSKDKIKGMYCFAVYNKRDSICPDCLSKKAIASKEAVKEETERVCADGTHLSVNITTYPVYDSNNNLKYLIKIVEDISELKKIEQAKKNMIRDISHSLKTPIAMAEMAFNIAKNSMNTGNKEEMVKAEKIASGNLKKLRKDVTNILLEFSIDVHKDVIDKSKKASLRAVVKEAYNELKAVMEEKGLQFETNLALNTDNVKIEGRDLKTILNNLLDNAIKFTEKGNISVSSRLNGEMIEIEVKDTGCGVSEKDIKKVFDKFYKRHASIEGTGLGLSICKEMVEMYDGNIRIYSEGAGKGTTVIVKLPAA